MRVAAFVIGLIVSLLVLFQSFVAGFAGSFVEAIGEEGAGSSLATGAGVGFWVFLLGIIGTSLVLKFGVAGGVLLLISSALGIAGGATTAYKDLIVWGILLFLAGVFGIAGRQKEAEN